LTVISFLVRVHVLSVHITFTHHRVSTEDNCFISAFFFANLQDASDNATLTCAGNHCGTIAAAIHIANINASVKLKSAANAIIINIIPSNIVHIVSFFAIFSNSF
jgi:hypothetical protein